MLESISNIDLKKWSELVKNHPYGSTFQSPEMYELFRRSDKFKPVIVGVSDEQDNLKGLLLAVIIREKRSIAGFFSSRTVIYGGPLIPENEQETGEILDMLLQALINKVKHKSIFIQFRNFFDLSPYLHIFKKHGFTFRERLNFIVKLDNHINVWKRMSESRRRQIKKGLGISYSHLTPPNSQLTTHHSRLTSHLSPLTPHNHAKIITPKTLKQVREFYDILYLLYRYKVRKPLPKWSFFKSFYEVIQEFPERGVILLVEYQDNIIGGILSPITPGKTIYEWYVCGLDQEFKNLYPSVLATWAAMDYGLKHGIGEFDFMGVGIPGKPYGVRDFKERFGGEMVNYGRFSRINNKFLYIFAEMGYNLLALVNRI
jgi:lipid II:glycine glycyltransferase (peptidoglycan interpeptide bridge formation enzyme)